MHIEDLTEVANTSTDVSGCQLQVQACGPIIVQRSQGLQRRKAQLSNFNRVLSNRGLLCFCFSSPLIGLGNSQPRKTRPHLQYSIAFYEHVTPKLCTRGRTRKIKEK